MGSIAEWCFVSPDYRVLAVACMGGPLGCMESDWQRERVLGEDLAGSYIAGRPDSGFGSALSLNESGLIVGSEIDGMVEGYDFSGDSQWCFQMEPGVGFELGWSESGPWAWQRGGAIHFFDTTGNVIDVRPVDAVESLDVCPDGRHLVGYGRGSTARCSDAGELWTECVDDSCTVFRDGQNIAESSPGSAVDWMDDVACWGNATLAAPDAGGEVRCEDGRFVQGMEGEHLASSMAGNRVAGQFSKWLIPARGRVISVAGGEVWSVDRAAERSRIVLSYNLGRWAIGIPGYLGTKGPIGRVYLIDEFEFSQ